MGARLTFPTVSIHEDRTFIVTGANGGIGYETAKYIAAHGGRVIIACRSEEKAKSAIEKMQQEYKDSKEKTPNGPDALNVEFMKLDLESLASTMEFIEAFKAKGYPLHVLICNAGIAYCLYGVTNDGYERMFQINYLSHLLIILHLLPLLRSSAPNSRIVMVSSLAHRGGSFDLENLQGKRSYSRISFYNHSKLYQVMSMFTLGRRLRDTGIGVFSLHPGVVGTDILRNSWSDSKVLVPIAHGFLKLFHIYRNPYQGAATTLVAALDPKYDGKSDLYFDSCQPTEPVSLAKNVENQESLWKYSLECLKDYINEGLLEGLEEEFKIKRVYENLPDASNNVESNQDVKDETTKNTDTGEGRDDNSRHADGEEQQGRKEEMHDTDAEEGHNYETHDTESGEGRDEVTREKDTGEGQSGCEKEKEQCENNTNEDVAVAEVHATDTDGANDGKEQSKAGSEDREDDGHSDIVANNDDEQNKDATYNDDGNIGNNDHGNDE